MDEGYYHEGGAVGRAPDLAVGDEGVGGGRRRGRGEWEVCAGVGCVRSMGWGAGCGVRGAGWDLRSGDLGGVVMAGLAARSQG